jgi:hypothetical protein
METQPDEETGDNRDEGPETTLEGPQSKLRYLRPDKDPMGASRSRFPEGGVENHS